MPAGMTRPFGHQGLVDGADESATPPATPGFLSTIYAAGVADVASVDNLMTGTLQRFFVNLGATPPPFPPNAQPFFPESALFVGEFPADTGVGADSKPLWRLQRHFSTFPSVGDSVWFETQYDLFAGGVNTISGGDRNQHVVIDQFDNRLTFGIDTWQITRPGLNAPGYTPTYLDNAPVSYHEIILYDALGSGNTNDWQFNSDGSQFRRVLIPNVTGGGGGPAGPWSYVADAMSMWSRNGGEPLVGSRLYYDAITAQTFGAVDDSMGQLMLAESVVLDAKNLGSGQAAGHGERWVRSTLGGPLTLVAQLFDTGYVFPQGIGTSADSTFGGTTDTFTGNVVVDGLATQMSGSAIPALGVTGTIDLLASATYTISLPTIAGKSALACLSRLVVDTHTGGAATGTAIYTVGNDVGVSNMTGSAGFSITASLVNTVPAGTALPISVGAFSAGGVVDMTTTQLSFKLVTPFGGATTLTGRFFLAIWYV